MPRDHFIRNARWAEPVATPRSRWNLDRLAGAIVVGFVCALLWGVAAALWVALPR